MAVPKKKHSKARKNRRKAQWKKMNKPTLAECPRCHEPKRPHHICGSCGHYKGRSVTGS